MIRRTLLDLNLFPIRLRKSANNLLVKLKKNSENPSRVGALIEMKIFFSYLSLSRC